MIPRLSKARLQLPRIHTHTRTHPLSTSRPPRMRVPYAPTTPASPSAAPIYARIAARRHPRPLIPLDLALLHNPAVADGWSSFIGAIRTATSLPASVRELAIARIAALNGAVHEWDVHAALALGAGVGRGVLRVVLGAACTRDMDGGARDEVLRELSEVEHVVLLYTDQMTVGVRVEDAVAQRVRGVLGDTGLVELTATVAAYNCVSRFLVALDVGECNARGMKGVDEL